MTTELKKILTIGGSDSGGAAGIQADLKTITVLGGYGMSVITAVTAQNSHQVAGVQWIEPAFVQKQIEAVLSDYGADAIKTGFLGRVDTIQTIAQTLQKSPHIPLIIDPVLVNHQGHPLFAPEVVDAYRQYLFPLADLITPNWAEGQLLLGATLSGEEATMALAQHTKQVLLKGERDGFTQVDWLFVGGQTHHLNQKYIATQHTHGSGDTLSAAIGVRVANGDDWLTAVKTAHQKTHQAIQQAAHWQMGAGHGPLNHYSLR